MNTPTPQQGNDTVNQMQAYLKQSGYTPPAPSAPASSGDWYSQVTASRPQPGYLDRVGNTMAAGADTVAKGFSDAGGSVTKDFQDYVKKNQGADPLTKVLNTAVLAGHTAGNIAKGALGVVEGSAQAATAPVTALKDSIDHKTVGEHISHDIVEPIMGGASAAAEALAKAHPEVVKWLADQAQAHPDLARGVGDLVNTLGLTGAGKIAEAPVQGAVDTLKTLKTAATGLSTGAKDVAATVGNAVSETYKSMPTLGRAPIQEAAAKGQIPGIEGLGEQTKTSAQRLVPTVVPGGLGAAIKPKPVDVYDAFASQEAKHIGDIKEDPAISVVGERIGDAFGDVVKQRQEAGATMSTELEKTASKTVDLKAPLGEFQKELLDNGASYDAINRDVVGGPNSKFATADKQILQKYAQELQDLGSKPTMKALDAFVSRIPKEIEGLKSTNKIEFKTNAERIVNKNLDSIRSSLGSAGTKEYKTARAAYSKLSKFIDEGSKYLGNITQSGDYAKDSSIAKSAVQSVLNNGKKDWLIELENKTGYPALDEAVLALQAMKDAGDFKGNSLLELLSDGVQGAAGGPHGAITSAILGFGRRVGSKTVLGSKAEQTRAFLRSLK